MKQHFVENFYTDYFDKDMLDFIKRVYRASGSLDIKHGYLCYGIGNEYFWTQDTVPCCKYLTNQQFKKRIGMSTIEQPEKEKRVSPCGYEPDEKCVKYRLIDHDGFFEEQEVNKDMFEKMSVDGIHLEGIMRDEDLIPSSRKEMDGSSYEYLIESHEFKYFEKVDEEKDQGSISEENPDTIPLRLIEEGTFIGEITNSHIKEPVAHITSDSLIQDCKDSNVEVWFSKEGIRVFRPETEDTYVAKDLYEYHNIIKAINYLTEKEGDL